MDGNRFDELTRTLATGTSRRRVLRGIVGGAAGGLLAHLGVRGGDAQVCRPVGRLCNKNANCCSNFCDVGNSNPFLRNRCSCENGVPPVNGSCGPVSGTCDGAINGTQCNDGNACTINDACLNGVCIGTPIVCPPCQMCVGGSCVANTAANGTACNADNSLCTQNDSCQAGACVPGTPAVCPANQCQNPGACNPQTGICSPATPKANGTACNADSNLCTENDTCNGAGACVPGTPVVCPANQCQNPGTCNPQTGVCSPATPKPINTPCNDGNACTENDVCNGAGACAGTPVVCPATQCQIPGTCNPQNGTCSPATPKASGTSCNADNSLCTENDACDGAGACIPGTPVVCPANQCQNPGTCNPQTGICSAATPKSQGTICNDGNACTENDVCDGAGSCAGTAIPCGQCLHCVAGQCVADAGQNGQTCNDGLFCTTGETCQNGVCTGGTPTCPAADCQTCDEDANTCVETCVEDESCSNGTCVTTCPNDRTLLCPGMNGHKDKCCPTDNVCSYSPSGAVNCRNDEPDAGTCGGPCRTSGNACDSGLNCFGDNPPASGSVNLCGPSSSNQMCCASTGFVLEPLNCRPTNDVCYSQPNIVGACGCYSVFKFNEGGGDVWRIDCCDEDMNNPGAGNCELCTGGVCPG